MDLGFVVGWVGVAFGLCVPIPQLVRIIRTGEVGSISLGTYSFLCCALICYLIHAIYIDSIVFTVTQSVNLTTNTIILILLIRRRGK